MSILKPYLPLFGGMIAGGVITGTLVTDNPWLVLIAAVVGWFTGLTLVGLTRTWDGWW